MIARSAVRPWLLSRPMQPVAVGIPTSHCRRLADARLPHESRLRRSSKASPAQLFPQRGSRKEEQLQERLARTVRGEVPDAAGAAQSSRSPAVDPPPYANEQEEFRTGPESRLNTAPKSAGGGPGPIDASIAGDVDAAGAPRRSPTQPDTTESGTSSSAADRIGADIRSGRLPDLTKGIPSTLEDEYRSSQQGPRSDASGGGSGDGSAGLPSSTGGRESRELPKTAYISSIERRKGRLARIAFAGLVVFCATGAVYMGRNWSSEEEESRHADAPSGWGLMPFVRRVQARLLDKRSRYTEPAFTRLLPDLDPAVARPFTLVLSLEDLLVHSEWSREHGWRMAKRPGVDYFLRYLQQYYELVIFTTTPMVMAEPVIRKLDPYRIIMWPLFREATKYVDGTAVKDLSYLNRDLSKVIIVDTNPDHVKLQSENAIILPKWDGGPKDKQLVALIPFLEYLATMGLTDTRAVLKSFEGKDIPTEFAAREAVARRKFEEQMGKERTQRLGKGLLDSVMGSRTGLGPDGLEQTAVEAFEHGKMMQDYIRERGQKQYEMLDKEIQENGEKWLKEMAAEEEKMVREQTAGMKTGVADFFGGFFKGHRDDKPDGGEGKGRPSDVAVSTSSPSPSPLPSSSVSKLSPSSSSSQSPSP